MKILVIQEKFRHKGQILTINWILHPVHLKNGYFHLLISIYFIPRRVIKGARLTVSPQFLDQCKETKAKFANIKTIHIMVVNWIGTIVPGFRHILS